MKASISGANPDSQSAPLVASAWRLREAARCLNGGGLVAYPTEAVYGLGCDPRNAEAVLRLLRLKQRPLDKGLILIGARFEHLAPYLGKLGPKLLARIRKTWPGPHTWLLPAAPDTPVWLRGAHTTIAARVTAHPVPAALSAAFGGALVSTSANLHGRSAVRSALQVRIQFGDEIDLIVRGDTGGARNPTVIRDAASGRVVRPG